MNGTIAWESAEVSRRSGGGGGFGGSFALAILTALAFFKIGLIVASPLDDDDATVARCGEEKVETAEVSCCDEKETVRLRST